jgi:predicted O-methyltransferase YrrM
MHARRSLFALLEAASETARTAIASVVLRRSGRKLSLEEAVEHVFRFNCLGIVISPLQYREELLAFLEIVAERRPRAVVEIGTFAGGTLSLLARCAAADAIVVSVDLPDGEFGGGYPESKGRLLRSFATSDQEVQLVRADSQRSETRDHVRALLGSRPIELLFVDGDHSAGGVRRDLELYGPLLAEDGLVAFHDIVPGPPASVGGVPQFWSELRTGRQVREIVRDWAQGDAGIGLVRASELGDFLPRP